MSPIKNVLLAGAGGNLGPAILKEFVDSQMFNVFVLSRAESTSIFPETVKVLKTDYTPESLKAVFESQPIEAVISTLSVLKPGVNACQIALIDAAKAAGAKRFVPSEFGSDTPNPKVIEHIPFFCPKLATIEHLKKVESRTFTWTAFITGPFFDMGLKSGFLTVNVKEKRFTKYDKGETYFSVSNLSTIGKAVVSSLSSDVKFAATANRPVYVASHTVNQNEIYAAFEKVSGQTWTTEVRNSKEADKQSREAFAAGNSLAAYGLILTANVGEVPLGDLRGKLDNELLELPKEDLEADVKTILADSF